MKAIVEITKVIVVGVGIAAFLELVKIVTKAVIGSLSLCVFSPRVVFVVSVVFDFLVSIVRGSAGTTRFWGSR